MTDRNHTRAGWSVVAFATPLAALAFAGTTGWAVTHAPGTVSSTSSGTTAEQVAMDQAAARADQREHTLRNQIQHERAAIKRLEHDLTHARANADRLTAQAAKARSALQASLSAAASSTYTSSGSTSYGTGSSGTSGGTSYGGSSGGSGGSTSGGGSTPAPPPPPTPTTTTGSS